MVPPGVKPTPPSTQRKTALTPRETSMGLRAPEDSKIAAKQRRASLMLKHKQQQMSGVSDKRAYFSPVRFA